MSGCVDIYGYALTTGSWLLCGWSPPLSGLPISGEHAVTLVFENGCTTGTGLIAQVLRDDLGDLGFGVLAHIPGSCEALGRLVSVVFGSGVAMQTTGELTCVDDAALLNLLKAQRLIPGDPDGDRLQAVLRRTAFAGHDTLERFEGQFALQIDEAIACGRSGMLLNGWLMEAPPGIRQIRLRSGRRSTPVVLDGAVRTDRQDVIAKYGATLRSRAISCGFIVVLDDCLEPGETAYIEVEVANGDIGFLRLRPSPLRGLDAIRNTVSNLAPRYDEVQRTFDIIGPALSSLNRERLARPRPRRELVFGTPAEAPDCSVIVPLHGRIDYIEVQVALLAQEEFGARHEVIYVVDDPANAGAVSRLADSLFRRFGLPLRLLLLEENLGFAPACNAGLEAARGRHVCFLNSDVFGLQPDWLDRLVATLDRRPELGIVGPLLLFEDGTVQHQGMGYERMPEFGHWLFPVHPGKGSRPPPGRDVVVRPAITGACMVLSRQLAQALDGFDERYVIGDFEDSDLCLRARHHGVVVAVDHGVRLFHLERKSQTSSAEAWRSNVTLYNAWLHQASWAVQLDGEIRAPCGS